jgi:hypothetical protein
MLVLNPAFPSYSRMCGAATSQALEILQTHPEVAKYGDAKGYVYMPTFKDIFEKTVSIALTPDLIEKFKKTPSIEFHSDNYIRAKFGHGGLVIANMLKRTHTLYTGPQKVFCFTHTSMDGLGVINAGRALNMLIPPEYCFNKGVKAYVDIDVLAANKIAVWRQIGDNQLKVFCYSSDLRSFATRIEYAPDYFKEANLLRVHAKQADFVKSFFPTVPDHEFKILFSERLKRLVIEEDDSECETDLSLASLVIV